MQQKTPTKENPEDGYTEIFAWGADRYGQLGLGNKQGGRCYCTPKFCSFNIIIKTVACGEEHSAFITGKGQIFTVGSNSEGRLGLGDRTMLQSSTPCLVEALSNLNAVNVSCGWGHTAAVMDNGDLYTWGVGEYGALGIAEPETQWFPVKVVFPGKQKVNVISASCGTRHTAIVDDKGKLWCCGAGDAGQLGTGSRDKELLPKQINAITDKIEQAVCGIFHTIVLTKYGKVYAMGGNNFGQLGIGNKRSSTIPVKIKDLDSFNIVKVSAGHHSAALSDKGELFIWGTGVFGEFLSPSLLGKIGTYLAPLNDISVGGSFGAAVDRDGNIYTWGSNTSGELGMGDFEPRVQPTLVKALQGKTVTQISCGGSYTIALGKTINSSKAIPVPSSVSRPKTPVQYRGSERKIESSASKRSSITAAINAASVPPKYEDRTPPRESKAPEDRKLNITDELADAIKSEQQKRMNLEKQIEDLEYMRSQLLKKEAEIPSTNRQTIDPTEIKEKILLIEQQIDSEKSKEAQILKDLESARVPMTSPKKAVLEKNVLALEKDIETLRDENMRLRGERISQKAGENSRLSELLKEYEDKIEREIEEKHRILRDKQKEIANLHDFIPKLKQTISEVEADRMKLEEYYREEIKKLEQILDDYSYKISQEDKIKADLNEIRLKNADRTDELHKMLLKANEKKDDILKEIQSCKNDIDQLHSHALSKEKELDSEYKKQDSLKDVIKDKDNEYMKLKDLTSEKESQGMEEINKLRKAIGDKGYDNEDLQNKINVRQIEIDTLNKDVVAWKQVANNVASENEALAKIIEALEEKNKKLAESLNDQLNSRTKENHERVIKTIKESQSPMKIRKILSGEQNLNYTPAEPLTENVQNVPARSPMKTPELGLSTHGQIIKALEAYGPEEGGDEGKPLDIAETIVDPYLQEREVLHDFELTSPGVRFSPTKSKSKAPQSTDQIIEKIGVESPIRRRIAREALSPGDVDVFFLNV